MKIWCRIKDEGIRRRNKLKRPWKAGDTTEKTEKKNIRRKFRGQKDVEEYMITRSSRIVDGGPKTARKGSEKSTVNNMQQLNDV